MHAVVVDILKEVNFNTDTLSDILRQLGTHFGVDLIDRKAEVKASNVIMQKVPPAFWGMACCISHLISRRRINRVFSDDCSTRLVYDEGAKEIALSVVSGINSSIFAYGQTSSGKT